MNMFNLSLYMSEAVGIGTGLVKSLAVLTSPSRLNSPIYDCLVHECVDHLTLKIVSLIDNGGTKTKPIVKS